jgi:hypothetical protein
MLLSEAEDNNWGRVHGERSRCLAQSKTPCTWRSSLDGTWEISAPSGVASLERAAKVNTAKLPRTVLRSRTTSYYRRSRRTMALLGRRSLWREGR